MVVVESAGLSPVLSQPISMHSPGVVGEAALGRLALSKHRHSDALLNEAINSTDENLKRDDAWH